MTPITLYRIHPEDSDFHTGFGVLFTQRRSDPDTLRGAKMTPLWR